MVSWISREPETDTGWALTGSRNWTKEKPIWVSMSWPAKATVSTIQATHRPMSSPAASSVTIIAARAQMPSGSAVGQAHHRGEDQGEQQHQRRPDQERDLGLAEARHGRPAARSCAPGSASTPGSWTWVKAQTAGLSRTEVA